MEILFTEGSKKVFIKYGGGLSNTAYLKLPHGAEWIVELTDSDGEVWFQNGWQEFANYHSLKQGHLLVLRLKEIPTFVYSYLMRVQQE